MVKKFILIQNKIFSYSKFENQLNNFIGNPEKLMIEKDLDFTVTKNYIENERLLSCINVRIYSDFISSEFH